MSEPRLHITAVVPAKDRADFLRRCLPSLVASAERYGSARIVVCDNASRDDSAQVASSMGTLVTVCTSNATRVGGVRNDGAHTAGATDVFAFVDCDCVVPDDFFEAVNDTLKSSGASAVGCEVLSPSDGHWTERAWDTLHRPGGDGPRHYINSACFCIRQEWFARIGGFDREKVSSEDVDICRRLTAAGGTMWQSERLAVLHLGNPKSIRGLYRRICWHGEGVWENGKGIQWSVTTIATFLHLAMATAGAGLALFLLLQCNWFAFVPFLGGLLCTPLLFVVARGVQHRRLVPLVSGVGLMSITFPARLHGLMRSIIAAGRAR